MLNTVRYLAMFAVMLLVWLLLAMVYFNTFVPPFKALESLIMPWERFYSIPSGVPLQDRLDIMQALFESTVRVGNVAFIVMTVSFAMFSIFLTVLYQQKQRRSQENRLLMIKNSEIARRNEFIRYISATIGHEFKNNLGRIKRRIDLLDFPPEAKARIGGNLNKLFADIDIFKKISDEREAGLIEFEPINLRDMLLDMIRQHGDLADFNYQGGVVASASIFAAPTLLKTVFENLIDNSVKYKKPDRKRASIAISCSLDVDGTRRYMSVSFRDDGLGMDEPHADKCFYESRSSGEGWGRGLYFAKYVVGLHAGKIRVGKEYTAPGVGTEIIIKLPFVEELPNV
jgi:signal transduction histidine kinase